MRIKDGLVDKTKSLRFSFNGETMTGLAGDTLASALLANDRHFVARSFKYHRPRGIFSAGSEEPNALLTVGEGAAATPNTRATVVELTDGLVSRSQNHRGSLEWDRLAINDLLSPFLSAGFYYKTFMWPAAFWEKLYEPAIRKAAGLGALSGQEDPDRYDKGFRHCDLLVIGAGPAGLMAAMTAGRAGKRVILADEDFRLGGRLNAESHEIDGRPGHSWASAAVAELAAIPNVRLMPKTTVIGAFDHGIYGAVQEVDGKVRQILWRIYAGRAVLAAGATERSIAFAKNDRPGVMLAGAVRSYLNRFGVAAGQNVAVFANNDDGWRTAHDLAHAGVKIAAIIDSRPGRSCRLPWSVASPRSLVGWSELLLWWGCQRSSRVPARCACSPVGWGCSLCSCTSQADSYRWSTTGETCCWHGLPNGRGGRLRLEAKPRRCHRCRRGPSLTLPPRSRRCRPTTWPWHSAGGLQLAASTFRCSRERSSA